MLTHIRISDFAIIDELDIELPPGLTVMTGETGAGKSIMIDAIGLVLGDRADANTVRHGADKAEISVTLDIEQKRVRDWLTANDLENEEECILRRIITKEGRSRNYINGSPSTLAMMRDLGEQLVDIHGQHAHQSLINSSSQRELLDAHGNLQKQLEALASVHHQWHQAQTMLDQLRDGDEARQAKIDLLSFQVTELQALALQENEIDALNNDLNRLGHAEQLKASATQALEKLYEEESSLYQQLGTQQQQLTDAAAIDKRFNEPAEMLQNALIQIDESVSQLRDLDKTLDADPTALSYVDERLGKIHDLARKHRVEPTDLLQKFIALDTELNALTGPETSLDALEEKAQKLAADYDQLAEKIRQKRKSTAIKLNKHITTAMQELGMEGGIFSAEIEPLKAGVRKAHGIDEICFLVSTNPGNPPQPLSKVASGGELSRISLAIQLEASAKTRVPTMIFDEVDSGVGGAIAEVVGKKLQSLGTEAQVFCVTHLPQVAACGHHHFQVNKTKSSDKTTTSLKTLKADQRVDEIARMLGGKTITEQTRRHAEEMLELLTR